MENSQFVASLAADFARLRSVLPGDPAATVPSCPDWTVADLTQHLGIVYLHKAVAMRDGAEPEPWPPPELTVVEPLALLDRGYGELMAEFTVRDAAGPAGTWYPPDQTVGFWIRRMAQETVIHRIDAELGVGVPVAPVPDNLAVDGIDELLKVFVSFAVAEWGDYFTAILDGSPGCSYSVRTDGAAWRVRTGPGEFTVADGADDRADVTVSGPPADLLRWVWNRESPGEPSKVTVEGPAEAVTELRRCITTATQ
jgi:uncharacterized protein (TIGR03083 family)